MHETAVAIIVQPAAESFSRASRTQAGPPSGVQLFSLVGDSNSDVLWKETKRVKARLWRWHALPESIAVKVLGDISISLLPLSSYFGSLI